MSKVLHAWYSEKQAGTGGTIFYRSVDGREIEATYVTSSKENYMCNHEDLKYLGEVTEYIRQGEEAIFPTHHSKLTQ